MFVSAFFVFSHPLFKELIMNEKPRASFGGKLSVLLVSAGSAIGLGALWRFPYMAGEHGGAAFLLVFLLCVLVVGIPAMVAEFAIGRNTKKNAVGAFRVISKRLSWLGYSGVICALLISGYYYIIAGWSLEYLVNSVTGSLFSSELTFGEQFESFKASYRPLWYCIAFLLLTHMIVAMGVEKGIEKASKVMMPALFIILLLMAVRVAFMPGAAEGYRFFLSCDFAKAFNPDTIMMAMGQAFFSLSVGMGCMVTYASYFKGNNNLVSTSFNVSLLTIIVSVLAGLVIFPAVFSAGMTPTEGPELVFVTLPEIFDGMPLASLWAAIFFVLVALAALTSTISFHEVITAYIAEEFKVRRQIAALITTIVSIMLCTITFFSLFGIDFFTIFDFLSANIIMPLGAFFTCVLVSWRKFVKSEIMNYGTANRRLTPMLLNVLMRFVTPALILLVFISGLIKIL